MNVLVTGGAGYIGSHTVIELLNNGYDVIIVDNLSNAHEAVIKRIEKISGKSVYFYKIDLTNEMELNKIFEQHNIDMCIHFAALKAVGVSVYKPIEYYHNNIEGTLTLIRIMRNHGCKKLIYSSSATIYGNCNRQPITEICQRGEATNPYGWTKIMLEQILEDLYCAEPDWSIVMLRYFNPIGAHQSGLLGEDPNGVPTNLMPYITQVAIGRLKKLYIYGHDYNTKDGTCVRDFIHVSDLATGHVCAIKKIETGPGIYIYNLGTGRGYTVLEVVKTFEEVSGIKIDYQLTDRRKGDVAICYSDPSKAYKELGWKAKYGLFEMCNDSWKWQKNNPKGYVEES